MLAQSVEDVRMTQERQEPVAQQVHRRLVAGDQQQGPGRDQLGVRHRCPGATVVRHPGQQVVPRPLAVALDQSGEILAEAMDGLFPLAAGRLGHLGETLYERGHPDPELVLIFARNAEDAADHRHRERIGKLLDKVELALAQKLVELRCDDALDLRA